MRSRSTFAIEAIEAEHARSGVACRSAAKILHHARHRLAHAHHKITGRRARHRDTQAAGGAGRKRAGGDSWTAAPRTNQLWLITAESTAEKMLPIGNVMPNPSVLPVDVSKLIGSPTGPPGPFLAVRHSVPDAKYWHSCGSGPSSEVPLKNQWVSTSPSLSVAG